MSKVELELKPPVLGKSDNVKIDGKEIGDHVSVISLTKLRTDRPEITLDIQVSNAIIEMEEANVEFRPGGIMLGENFKKEVYKALKQEAKRKGWD